MRPYPLAPKHLGNVYSNVLARSAEEYRRVIEILDRNPVPGSHVLRDEMEHCYETVRLELARRENVTAIS